MTIGSQQFMPLTAAYLCQDCDSIGNNSTQCPACASEVLMGLAAVLDRRVVEKKKGEKKLGTPQWAVN
jgi:RNA polymerase subunit RPABC4/transcription elongation factor Spt4